MRGSYKDQEAPTAGFGVRNVSEDLRTGRKLQSPLFFPFTQVTAQIYGRRWPPKKGPEAFSVRDPLAG